MFDHCLYFNTSALARLLDRLWSEAFSGFELTPAQGFLLRAVLQRPGLTQAELAELMSITRPTATRSLDGLQRKLLIERRASSRDAREQLIFGTRKAREIEAELNSASTGVTRRLKQLLGNHAFEHAVQEIRGIRSALE